MEHEPKEPRPDDAEAKTSPVRSPEDIQSITEGQAAAISEGQAEVQRLGQEGKRRDARSREDVVNMESVKQRVIAEFSDAPQEEIVEAFRERNETFKDRLALFLEPIGSYKSDGVTSDLAWDELESTRKNLGLLWTELETLKWLAGNNNARIELHFQGGASHVADTGREVPPDMK